jgi:TM2 domain-containing membrane protein YozV
MSTFTDAEVSAMIAPLTPEQRSIFHQQFNSVKKSRGTAVALSVIPFVGHLGFGRFYLGQAGLGILHVALMLLFLIPGIIFWIVDWFLIGKACDNWNREKAREIAAQVRAIGSMS